jgi:hypothetical protein
MAAIAAYYCLEARKNRTLPDSEMIFSLPLE